jgi:hypothetical protein
MKSLANRLLQVAGGVLTDYSLSYPTDKKDVDRDLSRLTLLVKNRGLSAFTLDLPELDAILLDGLQSERLSLGCPLSRRASPRIHVPRLFRGIWLRIFDVSGSLKEEPDPTAVFFLRQLCCLGKKLEVGCTTPRIESVFDEYRKIESSLHQPTLCWSGDDLGTDDAIHAVYLHDSSTRSVRGDEPLLRDTRSHSAENQRISNLLRKCQRNFDAFSKLLGSFEPLNYCRAVQRNGRGIGFKHGPGAVADLKSKEFKYDFPNWPAKLEALFPFTYCATTSPQYIGGRDYNAGHQLDIFTDDYSQPDLSPHGDGLGSGRPAACEPSSRLYSVPKTAKGPRLIASEPTAHQWCQQLTARFLIERSRTIFGGHFVTINDQEPSKEFALRASLTGQMATVDLSSASDRLSCWLVERAYRSNPSVLRALHSHRTRSLFNPMTKEYFLLRKFATQGTAVTFPVQSFIFLIIALTASGLDCSHPDQLLVGKGNKIDRLTRSVRVFGDDIIVPKHGYDDLHLLLTTLGLKVNESKSFSSGSFRESCGGDYFQGYDVTPVKTKKLSPTDPTSRQSLIDYSNNLFQKGLWNAAAVVESMVPKWILRSTPVTGVDSGGFGLTSYVGSSVQHLKTRWNPLLQRTEVLMYALNSVSKRSRTKSANAVLQYFAEDPSPLNKWEHGVTLVPKARDRLRWEFPWFA